MSELSIPRVITAIVIVYFLSTIGCIDRSVKEVRAHELALAKIKCPNGLEIVK